MYTDLFNRCDTIISDDKWEKQKKMHISEKWDEKGERVGGT